MKFVFKTEKKNAATIGQVSGHNERKHPTQSQIKKEGWFTADGHHVVLPFRKSLIAKAKSLKVRENSVLAISVTLQVGNQTDWRDFPTEDHPYGKPKAGAAERLKSLIRAAKEVANAEFGQENIISMTLHTDESSPHVHIVAIPLKNGKLQAKSWLDGSNIVDFRARAHVLTNKHLECTYTPNSETGGEPHDPTKAAGAINGPKPVPTLVEKATEAITGRHEIRTLRQALEVLNRQVQSLFSQLKRAQVKVSEAMTAIKTADEKAKSAVLNEQKARREVELLQRRVKQLEPFEPVEKLAVKPVVSDGLTPRISQPSSIPRPR